MAYRCVVSGEADTYSPYCESREEAMDIALYRYDYEYGTSPECYSIYLDGHLVEEGWL